jgi:hypothetical protein
MHVYDGKGTVPENDFREQGLCNAVIKLLCGIVLRYGCHVICIYRFLSVLKCARYLLKLNFYQAGSVMKKGTELGFSKLGDEKGFKRGEWKEIVRVDGSLYIHKWKNNSSVTLVACCICSD